MNSIPVNLKGHVILTSSSSIQELCMPLSHSFNTTYFNFVRRFTDGSEACLTTDAAWTDYFYSNGLYKKVIADQYANSKSLVHRLKIIPWTQFADSPVRLAQSKHFNIGIGISLIFARDDYADFFHFGTDNKYTDMNELYSNYTECLIQFTHYFYDKGYKFIKLVTKKENRLTLPERIVYQTPTQFPKLKNFQLENFLSSIKPKRFFIYNYSVGEVFLTKIEMLCVTLLERGKTATEIGNILFKS